MTDRKRLESPEIAAARKTPPKSSCPFCAAEGGDIEIESCGNDHWVKCTACGAQGPFESGAHPHLAIALWNTRNTDAQAIGPSSNALTWIAPFTRFALDDGPWQPCESDAP